MSINPDNDIDDDASIWYSAPLHPTLQYFQYTSVGLIIPAPETLSKVRIVFVRTTHVITI